MTQNICSTQKGRILIVTKCFGCPFCIDNPRPRNTDIWACVKSGCKPLPAPNCEGGIPEWCPLEKITENGVRE